MLFDLRNYCAIFHLASDLLYYNCACEKIQNLTIKIVMNIIFHILAWKQKPRNKLHIIFQGINNTWKCYYRFKLRLIWIINILNWDKSLTKGWKPDSDLVLTVLLGIYFVMIDEISLISYQILLSTCKSIVFVVIMC